KLKLAERLGPGKFRLLTRRVTLPEPTDDGKTISDAALRLWERHRPRLAVRLVGVSAAGIVGDAPEQLASSPRARTSGTRRSTGRSTPSSGASAWRASAAVTPAGARKGSRRGSSAASRPPRPADRARVAARRFGGRRRRGRSAPC